MVKKDDVLEIERDAALALYSIRGIGPIRFLRLLKRFGSPQRCWKSRDPEALGEILPERIVSIILRGPDVNGLSRLKDDLEEKSIWWLYVKDEEYPQFLLDIPNPPPIIFGIGDKTLLKKDAIAIVGSRKASSYGVRVCEEMALGLAEKGLLVISGLALGIDSSAHRAALKSGKTLAVKGCGVDYDYPVRNHSLFEEIVKNGAVISELLPGTPPEPGNFPARNRIIAALSRAVLVIEAGKRSGSLITAYLAVEYGKDVMAIPGSIYSYNSKGCHKLIKEGAYLVESVRDVLDILNLDNLPEKKNEEVYEKEMDFSPNMKLVIDKLEAEPQHIDDIARRCGLSASLVSSILLELELMDVVMAHSGGRYSIIKNLNK